MQKYPQTQQGQRPGVRSQSGSSARYSSDGQTQQKIPVRKSASRAVQPNRSSQSAYRSSSTKPSYQNTPHSSPSGAAVVRRPVPVQKGSHVAAKPSSHIASSFFQGRVDHRPTMITAICMAAILIFGCLMQYVIYPDGFFPAESAKAVNTVAEIASSRGVRINEVMTSNKSALSDDQGNSSDWIELINASTQTVDITGWSLLDKTSRSVYFTFPSYQLEPDETVVVFASGHLASANGAAFHAPFRLSSSGDTLLLSDEHGTVVEAINIPALGANQSYARQDDGWVITSEYTPYLANTSVNYAALTSTQVQADSTLIISEIMADNASYPAPDGSLYDYIEIQNIGDQAINLEEYGLSDNASKPSQWKFPEVILEPGSCLLIYASGLDEQKEDGTLHANFGLRAEGECVLLYNQAGQVLDYVEFDNLKTDQSLKRQADGTYSISGTPTPGQAN